MHSHGLRPALLVLALVTIVSACLPAVAWANGSGFTWQRQELNWDGISQRRMNDTRADAGLKLLEADHYLWTLASERARDMLERDYLGHTTPEGVDAGAYMQQDGARYDQWTELRAEDRSGHAQDRVAFRIMEAFLNDAGARAAILGDFDRLGVAMAEHPTRRVYVILLAKASPPPTPTPTPTPMPTPTPRPAAPAPAAAPPSGGTVADIIAAAAMRYGVNPAYLIRVARCESGLNPRAYNPAGPYIGLFQFLPSTFYSYGGRDIYSAYDQADVAARMFARGLASHWPVCSR